MTNEFTKKKIAEIAKAMDARGFERLAAHTNDFDRVRFTIPSKHVKTYLGTFLNPFTVDDAVRL